MRSRPHLALLALAVLAPGAALAQPAPAATPATAGADLVADPVLGGLVREALERSPEYARAQADVAAEQQRVPQAGALPDPTLTLGIQNDGFDGLKIGEMETSYWQVMITQPFPWPGKRGRREDAARAQASAVEARLEKIRLTTTAEVERAYLGLLLVRGQLELLGRLETLWRDAEATTLSRYQVGQAPQSDLLRIQLERTRLKQRRIGLTVAERTAVQALNRLRVHPLDEAIDTRRRLADAPPPAPMTADAAVADAEQRSPDLALSRRSVEAAGVRVEAARQERWPDLSVSAGIMPRGGLEPMWTASVGITLPLWSEKGAAVTEGEHRQASEQQGLEATRQVVALRARERQAALEAALATLQLYREGLLVQSDATVKSTLSQYRVGKVPFSSVIEVMRGLVNDEAGYLQALADAQLVAIAAREVSLDAPPGIGAAGSLGGGSIPGASGGMTASAGARSGGAAAGGGAGAEGAPAADKAGGMGSGM